MASVTENGGVAVSEAQRSGFEGELVSLNLKCLGARGRKASKRDAPGTGISSEELNDRVASIARMVLGAPESGPEQVEQLALLVAFCAHTRDIRAGKGERALGVSTLLTLAENGLVDVVTDLIPTFVAEYGSFGDLNAIAAELTSRGCPWDDITGGASGKQNDDKKSAPEGVEAWLLQVRDAVVDTYVSVLTEDRATLDGHDEERAASSGAGGAGGPLSEDLAAAAADGEADVVAPEADGMGPERPRISLAGKWAPRRDKAVDRATAGGLRKAIMQRMFAGTGPTCQRQYRHLLARLTDAAEVVERRMQQQRWRDIHPARVPAVASKRYARALRNLSRSGKRRRTTDPDRVACAKRMEGALSAVAAGKSDSVKVDTLDPVALIADYFNGKTTTPDKDIEARWAGLIESVKRSNEGGGGMPPCIPIADVSGSMSGMPMQASIALSILLAEVAPSAFSHVVLPFHTRPSWVHLRSTRNGVPFRTLLERVTAVRNAPWGGSTDFAAALELILTRATKKKVDADAFRGTLLVCFTDMQYDMACRGYGSYRDSGAQHSTDAARRAFLERGFEPPTIVVWNLRGNSYGGYAATTDTEGVIEVSGYSQHLLKTLLSGGDLARPGDDIAAAEAADTESEAGDEPHGDAAEPEEESVPPSVEATPEDTVEPCEGKPVDDTAEDVVVRGVTPWGRLQRTLQSVRYEPVRRIVRESFRGP